MFFCCLGCFSFGFCFLEGLFVFLDVFGCCDFLAELGDEVVGDVVGVFEAYAAFADVGFGCCVFGVFLEEPL